MEKENFSPSTGEEVEQNQEHQLLLESIKKAKNAEERVKVFADIMDKKGVDVLLGLVPGLGDGVLSLVSIGYLLVEAKKVGIPKNQMLRILGHQVVDFGIGAIPILGDIADYFSRANVKSLGYFSANTKRMVEIAREKGVPEEKIHVLLGDAEKIVSLLRKASTHKVVQAGTRKSLQMLVSKIKKE